MQRSGCCFSRTFREIYISLEQNMDEANEFAANMQKNANEDENVIKRWVNKFSV